MKTIRIASGVALVFALLAVSEGTASAAGAALDPNDLSPKARTELKAEIDKARVDTPDIFKSVQDVAARAKDLDAAARTPGIPLTRYFKSLGPRAFYPMMELLVFDAHTSRDLPKSAESALRIGLLEAVGGIRDTRAIPALSRVLDQARDTDTVRAASEALAKIGTDDALTLLTTAATKARSADAPRERAILAGLHDCRREPAARFLGSRLGEQPDGETAKVLAKSLGGVGNAWAWKTLTAQQEAAATRKAAAEALMRAFVAYGGDVREAAAKALLVVDDPSTPALVAKAKAGASGDLTRALDDLDRRFANNPAR
jgi:HEAT repeat protein